MVKQMQSTSSAFTIVELLIVIVVIGILAAITVIAYNGVQTRANNTSRINAAKQYVKLLSLYAVQNNSYPSLTDGACLGGTYSGNICDAMKNGAIPNSVTVQNSFNAALQTVGNLPKYPLLNAAGSGSGNETGIFIYKYGVTNETPARNWRLVYWLQGGNQDCGLSRIIRNTDGSPAGTGAWTTGVDSGAKNSSYSGSLTVCMASLLNPDEY